MWREGEEVHTTPPPPLKEKATMIWRWHGTGRAAVFDFMPDIWLDSSDRLSWLGYLSMWRRAFQQTILRHALPVGRKVHYISGFESKAYGKINNAAWPPCTTDLAVGSWQSHFFREMLGSILVLDPISELFGYLTSLRLVRFASSIRQDVASITQPYLLLGFSGFCAGAPDSTMQFDKCNLRILNNRFRSRTNAEPMPFYPP